jgi:cytochrome c553
MGAPVVKGIAAALVSTVFAPAAQPAAATGPRTAAVTAAVTAADPEHGRILFLKHCTRCHGPHAWGDGPRQIPGIAGQRPAYVIEQLARFVSGERPGSDMHGPAMRDTLQPPDVAWPPAIRDLAAYLSQAAPDPRPDHGDGLSLALGERLYNRRCAECHGDGGTGSEGGTPPRIAGQHYEYLLSRLRSFATVHGLPADQPSGSAAELTPQQQQALADYLSRLTGSGSTAR